VGDDIQRRLGSVYRRSHQGEHMSAESEIRSTLRMMAWDRAKGELVSLLTTFHGESDKYDVFDVALYNFVKNVESNGLHE
jgi:hypothetical protein